MKDSKEDVTYSKGMLHSHCGPIFHDDKSYCRHFIPGTGHYGTCEKVYGAIDPAFWCDRFVKAAK